MEFIKNTVKNLRISTLLIIIISAILTSCQKPNPELGLKPGIWRGEISAQGNQIPFNFEVNKNDGS